MLGENVPLFEYLLPDNEMGKGGGVVREREKTVVKGSLVIVVVLVVFGGECSHCCYRQLRFMEEASENRCVGEDGKCQLLFKRVTGFNCTVKTR